MCTPHHFTKNEMPLFSSLHLYFVFSFLAVSSVSLSRSSRPSPSLHSPDLPYRADAAFSPGPLGGFLTRSLPFYLRAYSKGLFNVAQYSCLTSHCFQGWNVSFHPRRLWLGENHISFCHLFLFANFSFLLSQPLKCMCVYIIAHTNVRKPTPFHFHQYPHFKKFI